MSTTPVARTQRRAPLAAVMAADGISRAGNVVTAVAVPWFVLETTGSAGRTGLAAFAAAVPIVISLVFGGTLVDRFGQRRSSIVGDLASGVSVALIPLLFTTVGLAFWQLLALVFCGALLDIPASLARISLLPNAADEAGMRIERAYSINESIGLVSSLVGPAITGVLIVAVGATNVLWFDAASFGASALLLALFLKRPTPSTAPGANAGRGYWSEWLEGLRFVREDRLLRALLLLFAVMNLLLGPIDTVILPVYAQEMFGSVVDFGLLAAASGAGALAAALLFGAVGRRLPRRAIFAGGYLTVPLVLMLLALSPALGVAVGVTALMGFAIGIMDPLEYTIYFERIPERLRARALGLAGALGWCSVPVGRVVCGFLLGRFGVAPTLVALALVFGCLPIVLLTRPIFRDLRPPVEAATGYATPLR